LQKPVSFYTTNHTAQDPVIVSLHYAKCELTEDVCAFILQAVNGDLKGRLATYLGSLSDF
jgi:hypothetical protein